MSYYNDAYEVEVTDDFAISIPKDSKDPLRDAAEAAARLTKTRMEAVQLALYMPTPGWKPVVFLRGSTFVPAVRKMGHVVRWFSRAH